MNVIEAANIAAQAANAAYAAVRDQHQTYYTNGATPNCTCGYSTERLGIRLQFRGIGLHRAAVDKRAGKAWDRAYDASIEEWRRSR